MQLVNISWRFSVASPLNSMSISHNFPVSTFHLELHSVLPRRFQHRQQFHQNREIPAREHGGHRHQRHVQLSRDTIICVPDPRHAPPVMAKLATTG